MHFRLMKMAVVFSLIALNFAGDFPTQPALLAWQSSEEDLPSAFADDVKYPWIDAESRQLKPPPLSPGSEPINDPIDPGNRDSDWVAKPKPATPTAPLAGANLGQSIFSTVLQVVFLVVLVVLIVGLAALLAWAFFRNSNTTIADTETTTTTVGRTDRFEELPEPLRREEGDLLAAARRCYEQGEFAEAIVYLFSYQLIELDRNQIIRLTRGKTNRQYLRETRDQPLLASILELTINTFEDAFFGRYEIDRQRFEQCWNELDRFQAELQA